MSARRTGLLVGAVLGMAIWGCDAPTAETPSTESTGDVQMQAVRWWGGSSENLSPWTETDVSGTVGETTSPQPAVRLANWRGHGVRNETVYFSVVEGGGSTSAASATTDYRGVATVSWKLGTAPGTNRLRATVPGVDSVDFVATSQAGAPAELHRVAGNGQQAETGATLADPVVAKVTDRFGNALANVNVEWLTTSGGGSIYGLHTDDAGLSQGTWTLGDPGAQTAEARVGGATPIEFAATATDTATSSPPPPPAPVVTTVTVSPNATTLDVGGTATLSAQARDQNGNVMSATFSWSSSNTSVATVDANGRVTARTAGSATVRATASGVTGSASVSVNQQAPVVTTVSVSPATTSLTAIGATKTLAATAYDASGAPMSGVSFIWQSTNTAVATVTSAGVVTAKGKGSAGVIAKAPNGRADTATVTVQQTIASVSVTPTSATVDTGATTTLAAQAKDANGNVVSTTFSWSSANAAIASVDASGRVTGNAAGSTTVRATAAGVSASASITVNAPQSPPPGGGACPAPDLASVGFDDRTFGSLGTSLAQGYVFDSSVKQGSYSLRRDWSSSSADQGSSVDAQFTPRQKVYARFMFREQNGFNDGGIRKVVRFREAGYGNILGTLIVQWDRFAWFYDGLESSTNYHQNVGAEITPNQLEGGWHEFQVMNDISQSGALHFKIWIDGQLKWDYTVAASNQGAKIGLVMFGGTFNAPGANGSTWLDEVAASSSCISVQ